MLLPQFYVHAVPNSISLNASNYDAYESNEQVSVCAVVEAEELARTVIVQLTSQDATARSNLIMRY